MVQFKSSGYKSLFYCTFILIMGILFQKSLFGQENPGMGSLPVYNFTSKIYNAQEMNVAIASDNRGILYFANNSGILEYDGVSWRLIELINDKVPRSLTSDKKGQIFVGSENEIGFLAPDSIGNLQYVSLMDYVPENVKGFQVVWNVYASGQEVFYQTDNTLIIWDHKEIRTIVSQPRIHESFLCGNDLYARIEEIGLTLFNGKSFSLIPGGDFFAKKLVYGVILIDSTTLLIATDKEGLFTINLRSEGSSKMLVKPLKTQADEYLRKHTIYNALRLEENLISIGTWGGGLVVINLKGEIQYIIDKEFGLQDLIIHDQKTDSAGNIWLALSKGVSRVEILSPTSLFSNQQGLQGTVESVTSFNGSIYAATSVGVFYLDKKTKMLSGSKIVEPVFKPIDNLSIECWDLLDFKLGNTEELLVIANDQISMINKNHQLKVLVEGVAYDMFQSKLDPARVYIGFENGLGSLYFEGGKWKDEGRIDSINETISSISEDYLGNLWMGTLSQGVIRMNIKSFDDKKIHDVELLKYDTLSGLPTEPILVSQISGRLVFGTSKGIYKVLPLHNKFEPDSTFGKIFSDGSHYIHRISEQKDEQVWITTVEQKNNKYLSGCLVHDKGTGYQWFTQPFSRISQSIQHSIFQDKDGITWFGGPDGLYRYDAKVKKNYNLVYHTLIRKVSVSNGKILFGGTGYGKDGIPAINQPEEIKPILPYSQNSIIFDFSANSGENENFQLYSYLLQGYEKKWSEWSAQTNKEYTNLNEGEYVLMVKSKNIYGNEATAATFSFSILSPWYRTIAAYIGYLILLTLLIYAIVKVYTRNLRSIITERTAEVVRQKTEIEVKNKEITDSIHYASRIQSAILPPEEYLDKIINDFFILYMPRDIVSGDFYWIHSENGRLITVAADCTGHGVPGALMSMLGVAFLNEIVIRHEDKSADQILNELRAYVIKSLRQTGKEGENQDGMDISICIYDLEKMKVQFAGANNPLLLIRNDEIIEYQANKMPIGIHLRKNELFTLHEFDLKKSDVLYIFSDGYADQFGGPSGKKFMIKRFKELLLSIHKDDMKKQQAHLQSSLMNWMDNNSQVDDILVMGIKI